MEGNFRNTLIIVSAVIICGIFIHGLWTIRKNKNPYKLKTQDEQDTDTVSNERKLDPAGFDQDGIGEVRISENKDNSSAFESYVSENVIPDIPKNSDAATQLTPETSPEAMVENTPEFTPKKAETLSPSETLSASDTLSDNLSARQDHEAIEQDVAHYIQATANKTPGEPVLPKKDLLADFPELDAGINQPQEVTTKPEKPIYQAPVTQAKPQYKKTHIKKSASKEALKRNQMEIDFDADNAAQPSHTGQTAKKAPVKESIEPEVIALSVVMPEGHMLSGAALLPSLLTLGMKFGEMDIFHRHQDNAGNGKVTFSLANMMNPGTFDLDAMENYATKGITLFMTLPNEGDPFDVFEQMLSAAKQLSQEFKGQLLDDKRSVMTKQTEQHYVSKIRDFERRSRIAL